MTKVISQNLLDQLCALAEQQPVDIPERKIKVAICVGHNERQPGAAAPTSTEDATHEWNFWRIVAMEMVALQPTLAPNIELGVFYRCPDLGKSAGEEIRLQYSQAASWGADLTIELHFNAATDPRADYRLIYISAYASPETHQFATRFKDFMPLAGYGPVRVRERTPDERGGIGLSQTTAASLLLEPWFATNDKMNTEALALTSTQWAEAYLKGLQAEAEHRLGV